MSVEKKYELSMMSYTNLLNQHFGVQVELAEAKGMIAAMSAKIEELEKATEINNDGKHTGTKERPISDVRGDNEPDGDGKGQAA